MVPAGSNPPENPYRTVHARMSPPGAAWDEGFAAGQSQAWDSAQAEIDAIRAAGRAAATPDPPDEEATDG